jgi:hypothetical protein
MALNTVTMDSIRNVMGKVEDDWLRHELDTWWKVESYNEDAQFDNVDNIRLALVGDKGSEAQYDERAREGCCGSHSMEFGPSPKGHFYAYGFNYGH